MTSLHDLDYIQTSCIRPVWVRPVFFQQVHKCKRMLTSSSSNAWGSRTQSPIHIRSAKSTTTREHLSAQNSCASRNDWFLATNTLQRANIRSANRHIAKPCAHPRAELSIHPSCSSVGKTASISSPFIRFRMVVLPVLSRPSISVSPSPDGFF